MRGIGSDPMLNAAPNAAMLNNNPHQSKVHQLCSEINIFLAGVRRTFLRSLSTRNKQFSNLESNKPITIFPGDHRQKQFINEDDRRFRLPDGGEINYQIIGQEGPWVSVIQGGRHSLTELKGFSQKIASRGYRVVVHDRRNCGQSSLEFNNLDPEDNFWADDLYALLVHLNAKPAFVVGRSRGTRIAIRLILRHPGIANSIMLWGISGGPTAVRFLDDYYYGQYLRACRTGGMAVVCALEHFAGLIAARPENKEALLALDPVHFLSTMTRWRNALLVGKELPVMGLSDDELQRIDIPTSIVPYYDKMHPYTSSVYAHKMIPDSRFFDFDPLRRENANVMTAADAEGDEEAVATILCDIYKNLLIARFLS